MEYIDIFNANLDYLGQEERVKAHTEGRWHKTFHCWVVSEEGGGQLLFQARSPEMVNFPNCLDVSAAGHILAGESLSDGVREVEEELGIQFNHDDMHFLGYRVEVADQRNGQMNREYQAVHILKYSIPLEEYKPQIEEVSGLLWLKIKDGLNLFSGRVDTASMSGIIYNKATKNWESIKRKVNMKDFLPRIQNYYLTACIMGERVLDNKFPVSIS